MGIVELIVLCLATWRISSLLCDEEGPWNVFSRLRNKVGVKYNEANELYATNEIAKAFMCLWCISIYVSGIVIILYLLMPVSIYVFAALAFSAIAMLADKQLWRGYKKGH